MSLYGLLFFQYCHAVIMWSTLSSNCRHSPHFLSVSVCNIFVAWSCAAVISLSVSALSSPLDSRRNVSSSQISCLCWQYTGHALLCFLFILILCVVCLPFCVTFCHLIGLLFLQPLQLSQLLNLCLVDCFVAFNGIYKPVFYTFYV